MLRFSLLGFPISVHWMFWLNTALLGGGLSAESPREMQALVLWVLAAFVSIIIHELGHALLMRHYGARAEIHLYAFGGLAIPDRGFDRVKSILVSLAGPGAQILAGIPAWWLFHHSTGDAWQVLVFLSSFTQVSFAWALLNLAPVYPLDGGHVMFLLYEVIVRRKPSDKFLEHAQVVGMVILLALLLYANGNDIIRYLFK